MLGMGVNAPMPTMNDKSPTPSVFPDAAPGEAVRLEATLPLDWVEEVRPSTAVADIMADNLTLLRALRMLDEAPPADGSRAQPALEQLERRMDLLMLMASTALRGLQALPPECPCTLTAHCLQWGGGAPVGVGRKVWARVYLRHRIALPLMLPGRIVDEAPLEAAGGVLWRRMELDAMDGMLQDEFERFVFRRCLTTYQSIRRCHSCVSVINAPPVVKLGE